MRNRIFKPHRLVLSICITTGAILATGSPGTQAEVFFEGSTQEPFVSSELEVVLGAGMSRDSTGIRPIDSAQTHVRSTTDSSSNEIGSTVVIGTELLWWDMNGPGVFDANGNGYYLQRNGNSLKLFQYSGSSITQLGSTHKINVAADDVAAIVYNHSSGVLKAFYNGSVIIQESSSTFATAGLRPGIFMRWGNINLARLSSFESAFEDADNSTDPNEKNPNEAAPAKTGTLDLTGSAANPFISSRLETVLGSGMKISPNGIKPRGQSQTHIRSSQPNDSATLRASVTFSNGSLWWDMNGPGIFDGDGNGYYLQRNGNSAELFKFADGSAVSLASPITLAVGPSDTSSLELDSAAGELVVRYNGSVILEKTVAPAEFSGLRPGFFMHWTNSNYAALTSASFKTGSVSTNGGSNTIAGSVSPNGGSNAVTGSYPNNIRPYTFVGPKPVISDIDNYQETRIVAPEWIYNENFSSGEVKAKGFLNKTQRAWQGTHPTDSAAAPTDGVNAMLVMEYAQGTDSGAPEDAYSELGFEFPFDVTQLELSYDLYLPNNYVPSANNHKGFVFHSGTYGGFNANVSVGQENWGAGHPDFSGPGATPSLNLGVDQFNMGHSYLNDWATIYDNNAGRWQRIHIYIELAKQPGDYGRVEVFSDGKLITGTNHPDIVPRGYAPAANKQLKYATTGNYLERGYILGWMNHAIEDRETMYLGVDNLEVKLRRTVGATNNNPAP